MVQELNHPYHFLKAPLDGVTSAENSRVTFSELRYRRLFEAAQDGILILNAFSGEIVDANPFLLKTLEYSKEELLGKKLWEIGSFRDIVDSKIAFIQLQNKNYIRYEDLPLETKSGKQVNVEFVSNVYMVEDEKVIQCNIRNITHRIKAAKEIKLKNENLERLTRTQEETKRAMLNVMEDLETTKTVLEVEKVRAEAMLDSIGEGLIAVDINGKIFVINRAAENMIGWKAEELTGKLITMLPFENKEGIKIEIDKRSVIQSMSSDENLLIEDLFLVRRDKTRFPVSVNTTVIKLGGKIIGSITIFRDITREQAVDKAKSEFVSIASHQLRTPLGIAKWYLEAIKGEGYFKSAPQVAKEYLGEVYKSNERLLTLVRDLLSISRIDQGKIRNKPQKVDIEALVHDVVKGMNFIAAKNKITIHVKVKSEHIPPIVIDPLRVQEVIENLLTNAVVYSKKLGKVEVLLKLVHHDVIIEVKDTGIGISIADQKKLFTKFFRSENAVIKNTEGSGLGLYVVKSYVDGWGGSISVLSTEGKGSVFSLSLPDRIKSSTVI